MEVICLAVGMLQANCFIAFDPVSRLGIVVDPGDDADRILRVLQKENITITHILLTHGHFDHIMAVSSLKKATAAKVCIHEFDAEMLQSVKKSLACHMPAEEKRFQPLEADVLLHNKDVLSFAGEFITVLHTPGHTPGSVCFDTGKIMFTGDTLFSGSWGRCDFPGGSMDDMLSSLRSLSILPGDRVIYPGHNDSTTLDRERKTNYAMLRAQMI